MQIVDNHSQTCYIISQVNTNIQEDIHMELIILVAILIVSMATVDLCPTPNISDKQE